MATHLAMFAGPVCALGFHSRAARLLGAANAQLGTIDIGQDPADQIGLNHYLEDVQQA